MRSLPSNPPITMGDFPDDESRLTLNNELTLGWSRWGQ